jgi:hypothetical protein
MPALRLAKGALPSSLNNSTLKACVERCYDESHQADRGVEKQGFVTQTLANISNASFLNRGGDCWIIENEDHTCGGYLLASFVVDVDNKMCYWVSQAYVDKEHRGGKASFRDYCWQIIREYAKEHFAKHIVVVSSRKNQKAYCKLLGRNFSEYAALLKEDI